MNDTALKTGPHLTFIARHTTRDVTKNHAPTAALAEIESLPLSDFLEYISAARELNEEAAQ